MCQVIIFFFSISFNLMQSDEVGVLMMALKTLVVKGCKNETHDIHISKKCL